MPLPTTLQELPASLAQQGERTALVEVRHAGVREWRRRELAQAARALATGLAAEGLAAGERALLFAPNSAHWIIACLALLEIGAIPVPLDSQSAPGDLEHVLTNSGAAWAFSTVDLAGRLEATGADPRLVLLDAGPDDPRGLAALSTAEAPGPAAEPTAHHGGQHGGRVRRQPSDEAVLFYTSGTSGPPKGVPLTHRNLTANLGAILGEGIVTADDRLLLPLPLHHVYPFSIGLLAPLALGMPLILPWSITGPQLLRALSEGQATVLLGIPRLYAALWSALVQRLGERGRLAASIFQGLIRGLVWLRRGTGARPGVGLLGPVRRRVAPGLRLLVSGGAPLDPDLAARLDALGWTLATGYGLTETSPILAVLRPGEHRFETNGRALTGVELRVAPRPSRTDGGEGEGEVQARGENVFAGYLDLPEKTAEAFSDDGWFRTGDLGRLDAAGWLTLGGRISSRIVLPGGENVDPERMETRLDASPGIRESGVLEHEGRLAALLVPEPGLVRETPEEDLPGRLRAAATELFRDAPSHQRLGTIRVDTLPLPRTRLGKLRRRRLAARFRELEAHPGRGMQAGLAREEDLAPEDRQLLEDPAAGRVWRWLGRRFGDRPVAPDTDLRLDLGMDSLEWVSATLALQSETGIALEESDIARIETVRDLLRAATAADARGAPAGTGPGGEPADLDTLLADPESLLDDTQRAALEAPQGIRRLTGTLVRSLVRGGMRLLFRPRVSGRERVPDHGPCILAPNHLSVLDPLVVLAALDTETARGLWWGGWTGLLFKRPWTRFLSRSLQVLPVDPLGAPRSSLALGAAALARGRMLVWFPEGARSLDGELQTFRSGVGRLARSRDLELVPVAIRGSREALPPGRLIPRPTRLSVRFGEPLDAETLEREGPGEAPAERIAAALRERVRALLTEDAESAGRTG